MEMEKVEIWSGETPTHGFSVAVFRGTKPGPYVAKIDTYSPPGFVEYILGVDSMTRHDEPEEMKHEDLDQLRELTRQRITNRCGKIKIFDNRVL